MSTTDAPESAAPAAALSWEADWVQRVTNRTLTPEVARCIDTLSSIQRPYNWSLIGDGWSGAVSWPYPEPDWDDDRPPLLPPVIFGDAYMVVRIRSSLATFDMSELTNLVLAAHKRAVRVEVSAEVYRWVDTESYVHNYVNGKWVESNEHPSGPGACLRVQLNARQREGHNMERHPSIEDVLIASGHSAANPEPSSCPLGATHSHTGDAS